MINGEPNQPDAPHVRVIGPPRSGTNLIKYLIETHTDISCWFNRGWWKHAIIPPLMEQSAAKLDNTPTIILFRDPVMQMASFHKASRQGRTVLSGGKDLQSFLRSPIEMSPNGDYKYLYSSPIDYWSQFYYSVLNWKMNNRFFVDLDKLIDDPKKMRDVLYRIFNFRGSSWLPFEAPREYLGLNSDQHISRGLVYEETTVAEEDMLRRAIVSEFEPRDLALVQSESVMRIYAELCAQSCI
jgi:hypothetical protein